MQTCPAWHESLNVKRIDRYQRYNNTEGEPRNGAISIFGDTNLKIRLTGENRKN